MRCCSVSHYFPGTLPFEFEGGLGLTAHVEHTDAGHALVLETERYAHAVAIALDGFVLDDNYVSLEPGETRRISLRPVVSWRTPCRQRIGPERRRCRSGGRGGGHQCTLTS